MTTFNVTKRDILRAKKLLRTLGSGYRNTLCPIALSVRRHKQFKNARVGIFNIVCANKAIELPDSAKKFIAHFDSGAKVKPFKFSIYK